jgi:hypothetical protein
MRILQTSKVRNNIRIPCITLTLAQLCSPELKHHRRIEDEKCELIICTNLVTFKQTIIHHSPYITLISNNNQTLTQSTSLRILFASSRSHQFSLLLLCFFSCFSLPINYLYFFFTLCFLSQQRKTKPKSIDPKTTQIDRCQLDHRSMIYFSNSQTKQQDE